DQFVDRQMQGSGGEEQLAEDASADDGEDPGLEDQELLDLFADFSMASLDVKESGSGQDGGEAQTMEQMIDYINARAALSVKQGISLPFHDICRRLDFEDFTVFCLACSILSSTQTDYA
ncbi:MAG: hypothetical protein LUE87_07215, partial [Lachnospiraceae bacterium]|nr:hypothetical protein [Lachnospiraceae bacterium]